jgi:hypothetical protein
VSVEFIGMIQQQKVSETHLARGPAIDIDYLRDFAQARENAGFDRILVPYQSTSPGAMLTVAYAAGVTQRIHFMLAHRPGFVAPTLAARQLATLDQLSKAKARVACWLRQVTARVRTIVCGPAWRKRSAAGRIQRRSLAPLLKWQKRWPNIMR